jgi:hypothetical protein
MRRRRRRRRRRRKSDRERRGVNDQVPTLTQGTTRR